jgi:hypothetical protein
LLPQATKRRNIEPRSIGICDDGVSPGRQTTMPERRSNDGPEQPPPSPLHRSRGADLGRAVGIGVATCLFYTALVLGLTWPLATKISSELPMTAPACRFDSSLVAWALAHQTQALTSEPSRFLDAGIYHPAPNALLYGEAAFGGLPFFGPPFLSTGNPTLAINLTFLVGVILTAAAIHAVLWSWTGSTLASFLGAWTFLMTRWTLWSWVPCAPNYALLPYFPLIILLAARPVANRFRSFGLGLLVFLQGATSVYLASAMLAPLGLIGLGRWLRGGLRRESSRLLLTTLVSALALGGLYSLHSLVRIENPDLPQQSIWAARAQTTTIPQGIFQPIRPTALPLSALSVIALGMLSRVLIRSRGTEDRRGEAWLHATLWFALGLFLSLGPRVRIDGAVFGVPPPFSFVLEPLYEVIRVPQRLGIGSLMGASLLVGLAFCELLRPAWKYGKYIAPALALIFAGAMYAEYRQGPILDVRPRAAPLPRSYPLQAVVDGSSSIVQIIRGLGGPLIELPIPTAHGNLPRSTAQAQAMYRAIHHQKPLLLGYSGYWPRGYLQTVELARRLPEASALQTLRSEKGLETILVHVGDLGPQDRAQWEELVQQGGNDQLRLLAFDPTGDALFAVRDAAEDS